MAKAEEQENNTRLDLVKLARQERIIATCRAILPSLILLAALAAFGAIVQNLDKFGPFVRALYQIFIVIIWLAAAVIGYIRLKFLQKPSARQFAISIERKIGIEELAPFSTSGDVQIIGNAAIWKLAKQRISGAKYSGKGLINLSAKDLVLLSVFAAFICLGAINPTSAIEALRPNIWVLMGAKEPQISAHIEAPPWLNLPNVDLAADAETIDAVRGSIVELRLSGPKSAPKVSFGTYKQAMWKDENNNWRIRIKILKSGNLKIHSFGTSAKYKIKIRPDVAPIINGEVKIEPSSNELILSFNVHDEFPLKSAHLALYGRSNNDDFGTTRLTDNLVIDPELINFDAPLRIKVDSSQSALVGIKVGAVLVLEDMYGQKTQSRTANIVLPQPYFNTQIAKALQEVRLLLLRENSPYRAIEQNYLFLNDPINGGLIKVMAPNPILSAPKSINRAHMILSAMTSSRDQLPIFDNARIGLSHALRRLEYSQNLSSAKEVAQILWSIIINIEENSHDSKTKIAQAINNLKAAMQNNADAGQIAMLQDELKGAITEHLESLRNQSGEAGDMEVADGEIIGEIDIDKSLNDAQESAQSGDTQGAGQKLDELEEMLSNLGPNSEGNGAKGVAIKGLADNPQAEDLANDQQELADETLSSGAQRSDEELRAEQEKLLSKLQEPNNPEAPEDPNLSEARAHMETAIEELKAGNRKNANKAQLAGVEALRRANQVPSNGENTDPLGRNIGDGPTRAEAPNGTKGDTVRLETEPLRARDILEKLRQRLSRPNSNEEEKNYIENAIGRELER